jgi:hypothetical protein
MMHSCPLCLSSETAELLTEKSSRLQERVFLRCPICFLTFVPGEYHLTVSEQKLRYDQHRNDPNDENYLNFLKRMTQPLLGKLKEGDAGLDFGCGPGPAVGKIFQTHGFLMNNYDPLYFADPVFLTRQYDFVTCSEVAEHFSDPRQQFLDLDGLLKSSGSFLAVMTQILTEKIQFKDWWYHRDPTHVAFYHPNTFEWISQWRGWKMEQAGENVVIFHKG